MAATIFQDVGQPESAPRVLHPSAHPECHALKVLVLLSIHRAHRPDLTRKELKMMQEKAESATFTQLNLSPPERGHGEGS